MKQNGQNLKRNAFFNGILSLSGSIPWIAIKISAGASSGPECGEPCGSLFSLTICTQPMKGIKEIVGDKF